MGVIIDKIILLVLCGLEYIVNYHGEYAVIAILLAVIFACLNVFVSNFTIFTAINVVTIMLCVMNYNMTYLIPVLIYDVLLNTRKIPYNQKHYFYMSMGFMMIYITLILFMCNMKEIDVKILIFTILSLLLRYKTNQVEDLKSKNKMLRDDTYEVNLNLQNENRNIIEKQDYEINLAILNERNRIAREIHDEVGHVLSRTILQVGALKILSKEPEIVEQLEEVISSLNKGMGSIRKSVHDLHEELVDLRAEVIRLTKEFTFCTLYLEYEIDKNLPIQTKYAILAIIKESLTNIIKHSNADHVKIILKEQPAFIQFMIHDNGNVHEGIQEKPGMGLYNIKTRVENLKGHMNISQENGFKIFIAIPA